MVKFTGSFVHCLTCLYTYSLWTFKWVCELHSFVIFYPREITNADTQISKEKKDEASPLRSKSLEEVKMTLLHCCFQHILIFVQKSPNLDLEHWKVTKEEMKVGDSQKHALTHFKTEWSRYA